MSFIQKFTKRDLGFSIITGLATGIIAWRIFDFLGVDVFDKLRVNILFHLLGQPNQHVSGAWFIVIIPIIWILGVLFGYFLGQWFGFFNQFGRFVVIGFTNTGVDFGILNLLIAYTNSTSGGGYALIKVFAFIAALISSYILNKFWTFSGLGGGRGEFVKFVAVTVFSFLVNLLVSWFVATYVHPVFGLDVYVWANIANACGVASGLIFNFLGFKFAVFKN